MITYVKLSEKQESWGIDVTVNFTDKEVDVTKTFRFDDQEQITNEFTARMGCAIVNIENNITERQKPNEFEIIDKAFEYVDNNVIGNQKQELLDILQGDFTKGKMLNG